MLAGMKYSFISFSHVLGRQVLSTTIWVRVLPEGRFVGGATETPAPDHRSTSLGDTGDKGVDPAPTTATVRILNGLKVA
jgi:hypothetical protein